MDINAIIDGVKRAILPEIDEIKTELKITNARMDELSKRLSDYNQHLISMREEFSRRIDETNRAISRLYEVIVRREEHEELRLRLHKVEEEIEAIKRRIAV